MEFVLTAEHNTFDSHSVPYATHVLTCKVNEEMLKSLFWYILCFHVKACCMIRVVMCLFHELTGF